MDIWAWWLLLAVLMLIGELLTTSFFLLWIGVGALFAAVLAFFGLPVPIQMVGFLGSSGVLIFSSRKIFNHMLGGNEADRRVATNVDALIHTTGIVTKEIDNDKGGGLVKLGGEVWTALSDVEVPIAEGKQVLVLRIEGVKLIVIEQP